MGLLDKFMYNDIFKDDLHKIGSGLDMKQQLAEIMGIEI